MNEEIFKSILEKAVLTEYADIDNAPDHRFSLGHRIAMKRIFARYERNVRKLRKSGSAYPTRITAYRPIHDIKRKLLIAMLIIILMSLLVGGVFVYVSTNFHGSVYHDYTELTPKSIFDCPQTIEYNYTLEYVPDGFEQIKTVTSQFNAYTLFMNKSTNQTITLFQWVKTHYKPRVSTEYYSLEEIDVNDAKGVCIDLGNTTNAHTLLVWDNGDYIIEIIADLDKESAMNLSKNNKN